MGNVKMINATYNIPNIFISKDDPLSCWNSLGHKNILVDRFDLLNSKSSFLISPSKKINNPIYPIENTKFEEIFDEVIFNFISKNKNKKILLFWSGGVDSTAILCALLKQLIDKKQLIVLLTQESIKEYPIMYNYLLKNKIQLDIYSPYNLFDTLNKYYFECAFISGICADQLFLSEFKCKNIDYLDKNLFDGISLLKTQKFYTEFPYDSLDIFIENIQKYSNTILNSNILTLMEFGLLSNLCINFTHEFYKLSLLTGRYDIFSKFYTPFNDPLIQGWAFKNFYNLVEDCFSTDPKNYKKELKKYIYSFNKDESYWRLKQKGISFIYKESNNTNLLNRISFITDEDNFFTKILTNEEKIIFNESPENYLKSNFNFLLKK